jgi:capsule polysaccharide export protein KpsE/RkpR
MLSILLDIFLIVLLSLTMVFCFRLNNKILELKSGRKELLELIKTLDSGIIKTNSNIQDLKTMTNHSAYELNNLVEKAKELMNDLSFMNDTAQNLADKLEQSITIARKCANNEASNKVYESSHNDGYKLSPSNDFSKAREELMTALKNLK